ncbi:MAG TPA: 50S ribosomal protein L25 [Pyrinomonadaceae bacterium]|nr:50S ribosomal protein L25 [Pyrinomonadaceae bacterium]
MADKIIVKAEQREGRGKNDSRRLRVAGKVPVVIYGGGEESVSAVVDLKDLAAILRTDNGPNTLFSLDVAGVGASDVIFQARQIDPLRGRLTHADLRRFSKGEKIEVTIAIHLIGEPVGVKEADGVLEQQLREIKVLCEPSQIPDAIEYDVSELQLGDSIHVSDLKFASNIEVHEEPETMVAHVALVKEPDLEPDVESVEPEVEGENEPATEPTEDEKE